MRFGANIVKECLSSWVHLVILKTLMRNSQPMSQRQLARIVGIPWVTVHRALIGLGETGLIKPTKVGVATYWNFDRKCYLYETLLPVLEGLGKITPPLKVLEKITRKLLSVPRGYRLILFGSVVTGSDTSASDIDLCVVLPEECQTPSLSVKKKIDQMQGICLDKFGKMLNPYFVSRRDLAKDPDKELHRNIMKGLEIRQ